MKKLLALFAALLLAAPLAGHAAPLEYKVVTNCGGQSYTVGTSGQATGLATGELCSGGGSGGSTTNINLQQVAGTSSSVGSGATDAGTLRMVLSTNSPGLITLGAAAAAASIPVVTATDEPNIGVPGNTTCATDTGSCTLNAKLSRIAERLTSLLAGTAAVPTPATTGGLSTYLVEAAASDNHAVIKNGAGQVYHISVTNKSGAIQYLRLYNLGTGFNGCNSATGIAREIEIPFQATNVGGYAEDISIGLAFSTGISICYTGAFGQTDTTAATASASAINIDYK